MVLQWKCNHLTVMRELMQRRKRKPICQRKRSLFSRVNLPNWLYRLAKQVSCTKSLWIDDMLILLACIHLFTPAIICLFHRTGHVSHHSYYLGGAVCSRHLLDPRPSLGQGLHTHLHSVLCEILHHWCHCSGGCCSRRPATCCNNLPGILRQGTILLAKWPMFKADQLIC